MPRKKYNDEELLIKAMELREKGMSYREIARELGCSVYKVHSILVGRGGQRAREDAGRIAELSSKLDELGARIDELERRLAVLAGLEGTVKELGKEVVALRLGMQFILLGATRRVKKNSLRCKWIDSEGYCTLWYWSKRAEGWDMKDSIVNGRRVWLVNVVKHPLVCAACPSYEPSGRRSAF